jgi:hypothetical protein
MVQLPDLIHVKKYPEEIIRTSVYIYTCNPMKAYYLHFIARDLTRKPKSGKSP